MFVYVCTMPCLIKLGNDSWVTTFYIIIYHYTVSPPQPRHLACVLDSPSKELGSHPPRLKGIPSPSQGFSCFGTDWPCLASSYGPQIIQWFDHIGTSTVTWGIPHFRKPPYVCKCDLSAFQDLHKFDGVPMLFITCLSKHETLT